MYDNLSNDNTERHSAALSIMLIILQIKTMRLKYLHYAFIAFSADIRSPALRIL